MVTANYHTHTVFCDGTNTPEEIAATAMEKGFSAIGFSGHGFTDFDLSYCMKETDEYIARILKLREQYKGKMEVYLGVEEDAFAPVDRSRFDYIIGSAHYIRKDERYYPVDDDPASFFQCLTLFGGDALRLAESYYASFCGYIAARKPDIIGHFDLITKFDEIGHSLFLQNPAYRKIAEKYITVAAGSGCLFEVNTGAMARGIRTSPYPSEDLLAILKKLNANVILSSDSHSIDTLDYHFKETKLLLRDIGFRSIWLLRGGEFIQEAI